MFDGSLHPTSPTYFQAAQMASPLQSGLYMLPICLSVDPAVILQGVLVSKFGKYRLVVRILPLLDIIFH